MADIHAQNGEIIRAEPIAGGVLLPYNALTNPDGVVIAPATEGTQAAILAKLTTPTGTQTVLGSVSVSNFPAAQTNYASETGGNLATLVARTPVLGQGNAAASSPISQSVETAAGNITAINGFVQISLNGAATVAVQTTGTFVATLQLQVSVDGTTFVTRNGDQYTFLAGNGTTANNISGSAVFIVSNLAGLAAIRITATAFTSGTATVTIRSSVASNVFALTGSLPVGTNSLGAVTLGAGSQLVGDFGIGVRSAAAGAPSQVRVVSTGATTVGVLIAATAHRLYKLTLCNTDTATRFFKLYAKATAPTIGTDTPRVTIPLPPNVPVDIDYPTGNSYGVGLAYGITGAIADTDTTAVAANLVTGELLYA